VPAAEREQFIIHLGMGDLGGQLGKNRLENNFLSAKKEREVFQAAPCPVWGTASDEVYQYRQDRKENPQETGTNKTI